MSIPFERPFTDDRRKSRDRRTALRSPSAGAMKISFENPVPATVEAHLIETSSTGFRATHVSKLLEPGLEVGFESSRGSGRARVVWTHVLAEHRVSGFLLL